MPYRFSTLSLFFAVLLLCSSTAHAYIGPIIIIGVVGSIFGWVAAIAVAVLIGLSYPFYVLYRRKHSRKQSKAAATATTAPKTVASAETTIGE